MAINQYGQVRTCVVLAAAGVLMAIAPATALPPPDDIPEEVLRTEIITEARSPVDGRPLTAAEYAVLQEELEAANRTVQLPASVRQVIFLLRIRSALYNLFPFLPE